MRLPLVLLVLLLLVLAVVRLDRDEPHPAPPGDPAAAAPDAAARGDRAPDGSSTPPGAAAEDPDLEALRRRIDRPALEALHARLQAEAGQRSLDGELHTRLCRASRLLGRVEEAIEQGERAVELAPSSGAARLALARALGLRLTTGGLWGAATTLTSYRSELDRALELDPASVEARVERIGFLIFAPGLLGGDIDEARRLARELESDDPCRGALMLALALSADERADEAANLCHSALEGFPLDPDLRVTLAGLLLEQERTDEAAEQLRLALEGEHGEGWYRALYQQARLRVQTGQELEQAVAALRDYARARPYGALLPPPAAARWRAGQALEALQRPQEARAEYEQALRLDPDFDQAQDALEALGAG